MKGTSHFGLKFKRHQEIIPASVRAAVDADWGSCTSTQRPTTGFILTVNGTPIFGKSKLQKVVALSSGEAEYVTLSSCIKEVTWSRTIVYEIANRHLCQNESYITPTAIEMDSSAAMSIASNKDSIKLTEQISRRFHHVRHHIATKKSHWIRWTRVVRLLMHY